MKTTDWEQSRVPLRPFVPNLDLYCPFSSKTCVYWRNTSSNEIILGGTIELIQELTSARWVSLTISNSLQWCMKNEILEGTSEGCTKVLPGFSVSQYCSSHSIGNSTSKLTMREKVDNLSGSRTKLYLLLARGGRWTPERHAHHHIWNIGSECLGIQKLKDATKIQQYPECPYTKLILYRVLSRLAFLRSLFLSMEAHGLW